MQTLARVVSVENPLGRNASIELDLGKVAKGIRLGDSVCVNGVCLTATNRRRSLVSFDVIEETFRVTNLGELHEGSRVNIERSLLPTDRISGHLVTGHVDGTGKIAKVEREKDSSTKLWIRAEAEFLSPMIPKGSVAIDGISLTLVDVTEDKFSVCLTPRTLAVTTLGLKGVGDSVNIEVDMIGKYVRKYLEDAKVLVQRRGAL